MKLADVDRPCRLHNERCESEEDPAPLGILVYDFEGINLRDVSTIHSPAFIPLVHHRSQANKNNNSNQKKISIHLSTQSVHPHVRSSSKSTLLSIRPNRGERVRDDSHEKIDQPEIEHHDTHYEETARDEELGIDHGVHQRGPLTTEM